MFLVQSCCISLMLLELEVLFDTPLPALLSLGSFLHWISSQLCSSDPVKPQRNHRRLILRLRDAPPSLRLSARASSTLLTMKMYLVFTAARGKLLSKAEQRAGGFVGEKEERGSAEGPKTSQQEGRKGLQGEKGTRLKKWSDLCEALRGETAWKGGSAATDVQAAGPRQFSWDLAQMGGFSSACTLPFHDSSSSNALLRQIKNHPSSVFQIQNHRLVVFLSKTRPRSTSTFRGLFPQTGEG